VNRISIIRCSPKQPVAGCPIESHVRCLNELRYPFRVFELARGRQQRAPATQRSARMRFALTLIKERATSPRGAAEGRGWRGSIVTSPVYPPSSPAAAPLQLRLIKEAHVTLVTRAEAVGLHASRRMGRFGVMDKASGEAKATALQGGGGKIFKSSEPMLLMMHVPRQRPP